MEYGEVGSAIKGSQYVRDYCFTCGDPIRVARKRIGRKNSCSDCEAFYRGAFLYTEIERRFLLDHPQRLEEMSCGR